MKTLRVSLADLEGQPHGSHHANTNVTVTARYTGPVTLADGRIVPAAIKAKQLSTGATGYADFEVYASDDPLVHADWRDFAIIVTATITHARSGKQLGQVARTVKVLSSHTSPVALGSLAPAEGLPAGWVSVGDFVAGQTERAVATALADKIKPGKNLVNPAATHGPGTLWASNSTEVTGPTAAANYTATKPFPVKPSTAYTGQKIVNAILFDAAGVRIPGTAGFVSGAWETPLAITTPANAASMAVSYPTTQVAGVQVEQGSTATTVEPYRVTVPNLTDPTGTPYATKNDVVTQGWRHPRGATEENGDATFLGSTDLGFGYPTDAMSAATVFNRVTVPLRSTSTATRVRVYHVATPTAAALVLAGGATSPLLADVTLTPDQLDSAVDLGQSVTAPAGRHVVVVVTSEAGGQITTPRWSNNTPGDRRPFYRISTAGVVSMSSPPTYSTVPPRLDYVPPTVADLTTAVSDLTTPFPAHAYVDLWTSPIFDDGRRVYQPGQPLQDALSVGVAAAGSTTLVVSKTGYVAGQSLVTSPATAQGQTMRIAAVAGDGVTLTLADPLAHPIPAGQRIDSLWMDVKHINYSSNALYGATRLLAQHIFTHPDFPTVGTGKITLLGNSWGAYGGTTAWPAAATAAHPAATFVNAAVAGNTTAMMLARFATDVPADSDVVVLFEWVNDNYTGLPTAQQAANWRALVDKVHAIGATPVIVGPPPLSERPAQALAQEQAAAQHAGTSLRVLQLERTVAELQAQVGT